MKRPQLTTICLVFRPDSDYGVDVARRVEGKIDGRTGAVEAPIRDPALQREEAAIWCQKAEERGHQEDSIYITRQSLINY